MTRVLGIRVDDVSVSTLLDAIERAITGRKRLVVVNANAHLIMLARSRAWLRDLFDRADIAFCDGAGVQFAVRVLSGRLPHRHTPPQWIGALATRLERHGATVFWLGGTQANVEKAAERLQQATGLRAAGVAHGYFDMTPGGAENEALVTRINQAKPDLLLLTMGMPRQEAWLAANWSRLDVRVVVTAGALVDHVAGYVSRPPLWVADLGLEWIVRLAREPRRLWRRYGVGLPQFAALVLAEKAGLVIY